MEAIQSSALSDLNAVDADDVDTKQLNKRMKHHEKHAKQILQKMAASFSNKLIRYKI